MNIEELKEFQENVLERAKFVVKKDGDTVPLSYVLMYRGDVDKLKEIGGAVKEVERKGFFSSLQNHDVVAVLVSWVMSWKAKYNILYHVLPEEKRPVLDEALAMARIGEVDDAYMRTTRPLMEVMELDEKDVTSIALSQICKASDAFAIVNVMTAWLALGEDAKRHAQDGGSLEDKDYSQEVIHVGLESHAYTRLIAIPIRRRPGKARGTGKVTGWGKRQDFSNEEDPGATMAGRFTNLLKPLRALETA